MFYLINRSVCFLSLFFSCLITYAIEPTTPKVGQFFQTIQNQPEKLMAFIKEMPKGGDLHFHLAGAFDSENLLQNAKKHAYCLNPKNYEVTPNKKCEEGIPLTKALADTQLKDKTIDAWTMRNFQWGKKETGYEHFFNTFVKFMPLYFDYRGESLAEVVQQAASQHINYLEVMIFPDNLTSLSYAEQLPKEGSWQTWQKILLKNHFEKLITESRKRTDAMEKTMHDLLRCDTANADPGCQVKVRYQYITIRTQALPRVFTQLLLGFMLAEKDPRYVANNIVAQEYDPKYSLHDYRQQMQAIDYLHRQFPKSHISLHAGEIMPGMVPSHDLESHIHDAIHIAHAERIGHGVDISYEKNVKELLQEMAAKKIMVEINLTSNEKVLGVKSNQHPLPLYLENHVPTALSTDDQGIFETDLTHEYLRAAQDYHLSYQQLKILDRNSLTYSFLPGKSLWKDADTAIPVDDCSHDQLGIKPSIACEKFLSTSEKAQLQWQLEQQFADFETKINTKI